MKHIENSKFWTENRKDEKRERTILPDIVTATHSYYMRENNKENYIFLIENYNDLIHVGRTKILFLGNSPSVMTTSQKYLPLLNDNFNNKRTLCKYPVMQHRLFKKNGLNHLLVASISSNRETIFKVMKYLLNNE